VTVPPGGLVDTGQAAALLEVPAYLIRKWKQRGLAIPADVIPGPGRRRARPLYRLEELRPLAAAYHDTPTRSPRTTPG
jgi:hypothetical protein